MGENKVEGPKRHPFDIFIFGLLDYLKEKHKFAYVNRGQHNITFFYGEDNNNLKQYSIPRNNIKIKLPLKTIIKIVKDMINQRPPSDDLQPGEQDSDFVASETNNDLIKFCVKWKDAQSIEHDTIVDSSDVSSATLLVANNYKEFVSHVSTVRV